MSVFPKRRGRVNRFTFPQFCKSCSINFALRPMCLFYYSLFYICSQQKRPRKPKLSESHKYYPKFNRRSKNYSMIVATLPDPTVRPPSRYQTDVLRCANGDFPCDSCGKIRNFRCVRVVFGDFVIMVLS